jgi:hypothetical protein
VIERRRKKENYVTKVVPAIKASPCICRMLPSAAARIKGSENIVVITFSVFLL